MPAPGGAAARPPRPAGRLVVVGVSHRTSSEATRDRLFISESDLPVFLKEVSEAGFSEAVALSTWAPSRTRRGRLSTQKLKPQGLLKLVMLGEMLNKLLEI